LRADGDADDLKAWIASSRQRPFARLFALQARSGRALAALTTFESARSRTFLDALLGERRGSTPQARSRLLEAILPRMRASGVAAFRSAEELLSTVGPVHALLYFETDDALYTLLVEGNSVRVERVAAPLAAIAQLASRFVASPDDRVLAQQLGTLLIPPLGGRPEILYLAPSAVLAAVPFAALRPRGELLVSQAALAQIPSLAALAARSAPAKGALVYADALGDLPAARREGREVARLLGVEPIVGARATRRALHTGADVDVLHVAGHAGLEMQGSFISASDGRVFSADVLDWRLRPRLVVLSSCSSAASRAPALWGSLATSFLAAGATTVVAALRSVEDAAAEQLISDFYRAGGATEPVRALARVQRKLALDRPPSRWASFVAFGREGTASLALLGAEGGADEISR
jgi:hypothetical protein